MADTLTRADVAHRSARAARAHADEITLFAGQLTAILAYAEQVQQVDTAGVQLEPAANPGDTSARDDVPVPSLDRDVLLGQAPAADRAAGLFKVPRVLGS